MIGITILIAFIRKLINHKFFKIINKQSADIMRLSGSAARDNNKILRTHPPQVSSTEENLPRHTRRTLAQLRTNKSPFLLSYLHKIDASTHPSPLCPLCSTHEHTTQHLFSCPQIPTTLSALDLWRDPSGILR